MQKTDRLRDWASARTASAGGFITAGEKARLWLPSRKILGIMNFYRFRSTEALLGEHQELERQEIYFASPKDLNDPLEGFKDLVWSGDGILWRNLLRHYLLCLTHAVTVALISGPDHTFAETENFVFANESSLPTPEYGELHRRICEDFLQHKDAAALPELLAGRGNPIRRDELATYLRLIHPHALNTVLTRMEETARLPRRSADDPLRTASTKPIAVRAALESMKTLEREHPDKPDIAEVTSSFLEILAVQQDLILEYNGISPKSGAAWKTLIWEFPRRHIRALEELLYNDWYTACFVADPSDASMWGNYGNGHQGVCLKFNSSASTNGKPSLKLRQPCWRNGNRVASAPVYRDVAHEFQKVEYSPQFIEINFFRSLGRLTMSMLRHWYFDAEGGPSPSVVDILSESDSWRKQYWQQLTTAMTTKLMDWAHEEEFRLTLISSATDFTDASTRKLQYHFSDLQGIIFGINTPTSDKLRIMKIVEEKCRKEKRTDFEFHQAHYSRRAGKVEIARMSLIKFATGASLPSG